MQHLCGDDFYESASQMACGQARAHHHLLVLLRTHWRARTSRGNNIFHLTWWRLTNPPGGAPRAVWSPSEAARVKWRCCLPGHAWCRSAAAMMSPPIEALCIMTKKPLATCFKRFPWSVEAHHRWGLAADGWDAHFRINMPSKFKVEDEEG